MKKNLAFRFYEKKPYKIITVIEDKKKGINLLVKSKKPPSTLKTGEKNREINQGILWGISKYIGEKTS